MPSFALFAYVPFVLVLFARLGPARGLIWSVLLGYLFLPDGYEIEVPVLPPYGKWSAIGYATLLGALVFGRREPLPRGGTDPLMRMSLLLLSALLAIGPIGTWLTNTDPIPGLTYTRPGLGLRDALRLQVEMVTEFAPYFLAIRFLNRPEHLRHLLIAMALTGLGYCLLALWEVRMSPQISANVYGFFPHSWQQHIRGGGFRPIIFLRHGLWVAFVLFAAAAAAFALMRADGERRALWMLAGGFIAATLAVSNNLGGLMLAAVALPLVILLGAGLQARIAAIVTAAFLVYPVLATTGLTPTGKVMSFVQSIDAGRAASFRYRLENEERHLARASERPVFGWGGWARNRVFNEFGRDVSTTDGRWVSVLGRQGWVGYIANFGLLCMPVLLLGRAGRRRGRVPFEASGLAMITAGNCIYMVPNATLSPIGYLVAGGLAAYVLSNAPAEAETDAAEAAPVRRTRYSRFSGPPEDRRAARRPASARAP